MGENLEMPQKGVSAEVLRKLAKDQGVSALMFDTVAMYLGEEDLPDKIGLRWVTVKSKVMRFNKKQKDAVILLAEKLSAEGVRLMLLKGSATALLYPDPTLRESGDIDIWCFGDYDKVNAFASRYGCEFREADSKHSAFVFEGITVENHLGFNYPELNRANGIMSRLLMKAMSEDASPCNELPGVYLPSPTARALYLMMHSLTHMAWSGIPVRNLVDWTLLLKYFGKDIEWNRFHDAWKEAGLLKPVAVINRLCVDNLGLDPEIIGTECREDMKNIPTDEEIAFVLDSILRPQRSSNEVKSPVLKLKIRFERHFARSRMHELIYGEPFPDSLLKSLAGKSLKEILFVK